MQSDKAAKQKTVPGRLSVAVLYVTVNGLLIPGAPRTDSQPRPKKFSINAGLTENIRYFDAKWDIRMNGDLCLVVFKVSGLLAT